MTRRKRRMKRRNKTDDEGVHDSRPALRAVKRVFQLYTKRKIIKGTLYFMTIVL